VAWAKVGLGHGMFKCGAGAEVKALASIASAISRSEAEKLGYGRRIEVW